MASIRDLVRFEPSERADLPDFEQIQRGARGEARSLAKALLIGAAPTLQRSFGGFLVTPTGSPSSVVNVSRGRALASYEHPLSGEFEYGVPLLEGDSTLALDFTGKSNGTYGIWIRFSAEAGVPATRIFWNAATLPAPGAEEAGSLDTRYVVGWDAEISAASPGTGWQKVASVVWAGSTVSSGNITGTQFMFFEGDAGASYAHVWGDGGNDRNANRNSYGVGDLYTFVHAMRRQLEEIVGDGQKWYENFSRIRAGAFKIEAPSINLWTDTQFLFDGTTVTYTLATNGFQVLGSAGAEITLDNLTGASNPMALRSDIMEVTSDDGAWDVSLSTCAFDVAAFALTGSFQVTSGDYKYAASQSQRIEIPIGMLESVISDPSGVYTDGSVLWAAKDPGGSYETPILNCASPPWFFIVPLNGFIRIADLDKVRITCRCSSNAAVTFKVGVYSSPINGNSTVWTLVDDDTQTTVSTHTDRQTVVFDLTGVAMDNTHSYRMKVESTDTDAELRISRLVLDYAQTQLKDMLFLQ